jgi:hypothetical protein
MPINSEDFSRQDRRAPDIVAGVGLGIGAVLGLAGSLISHEALRQTLWMIDGVALVVATALLTMKFLRSGNDLISGGFLVFAIGEGLIVVGTLADSVPAFGGGVAVWAAALLLLSAPRTFASWVRATGAVAAILFVVVAGRIIWGDQLLPTSKPLPFLAYPFLVLTLVGWMLDVLRKPDVGAA